jgi:tellurite resistance protein TerC
MALWIAFIAGVVALVAIDLGLSHRHHERMPMRVALAWSGFWIALALAFGVVVLVMRGGQSATEYYSAWLLEKSLSVDNLFVFLLVFQQLKVPIGERHRVLSWGIFGALVLRGVMIVGGLKLFALSHALTWVFGALLVLSGLRTWRRTEEDVELEEMRVVRILRRILPLHPAYDTGRFFIRVNGRPHATMLLFALAIVELSDVVFAIDSIPAAFAVTTDPFIVFSSNILAVLGLRALFFVVADALERLRYLHHGLAAILVLIGAKMLLSDVIHVPAIGSLIATATILLVTIVASLVVQRGAARAPTAEQPPARP